MSIILSIYTVNAFKEFLLPSINNADHEIILQREFFIVVQLSRQKSKTFIMN